MKGHVHLSGVLVACIAAVLMAASHRGSAQDTPPTFRVETRLVEVDVNVRDRTGAFATDLTADDFEVLEDGVPQVVSAVRMVNLPVGERGRPGTLASGPDETPDAGEDAAIDPAGTLEDMGRLYVMILDSGGRVFAGAPAEDSRARVLRVARLFIEEFLGPTDLMAIMHVGQRLAAGQALTSDKALLVSAAERYRHRESSSLESFRVLQEAAVHLNAVTGRRKGILFIGGGTDVLWPSPWGPPVPEYAEMQRAVTGALRTAAQNNVRVHAIDPSGFATFASIDALDDDPAGRASAREGPRGTGDRRSSLRLLAEDTGGRAIVGTSNFAGNFRRIIEDHSAYYVLHYYSSAPRDGAFHEINVRVRLPGLSVRARPGYRAPLADVPGRPVPLPGSLSAPVRAALRDGTAPAHDLRVTAYASVFRAAGFEGSILMDALVHGGALALEPGKRIEVAAVAIDRWGQTRAVLRRVFTLDLQEDTKARAAASGVRLFGRLTLPAGAYEIRVVAHQPGGATAAASTRIEVPHFEERSLAVSDLIVASSRADAALTLLPDDVLQRALASAPAPIRRFTRDETLTSYAEVYDSQWLLTSELAVTATVSRDTGIVVARDHRTLRAVNAGFSYTGTLNLSSLDPGEHVLTIEAHTTAGIPAAASQQLRFEIVAPDP